MPRNSSLSTLNHFTSLFLVSPDFNTTLSLSRSVNPPRTQFSGCAQLASLHPLSSSFVSDGVGFGTNCYPFLNWIEVECESYREKAVVFRSLVATVKLKPSLDDFLEAEAVKFLKSVDPEDDFSADEFLRSLARNRGDSSADFVHSFVVLISSPSQAITTSAMEMLARLIWDITAKRRLGLVKADLIPQLINTLNPHSLSFTEAVEIHTCLLKTIFISFWLATPFGLRQLEIEYENEQQYAFETILKQVLTPSENYIWHFCVNRFSIVDRSQSTEFLELLTRLLEISPYYQRTMDFVLNTPVFLTIPSCLTFFETQEPIWYFLTFIVDIERGWNEQGGEEREMGKTVHRMLRMEGIEDVTEQKLQNNKNEFNGREIVYFSIRWNNLLGINLPEQE
ncbi:hypothetical protein BLNAU_11112 [Blattamonas nauphoetae]|uniref:Uncharacterized protein n=1 Tax=Blattamonas nauphoetae TaxID=2049346 RepID=A0ABQ9XSW1_9EUKA|nr:hypothetical protein BLNAU_11112 [Blattamonas nauphoetae]